jgi:hypothetical protein
MEEVAIKNSYNYGDAFIDYKFRPFYRITYNSKDMDLLFFSNLEKNKGTGFFFKRLKRKNIIK